MCEPLKGKRINNIDVGFKTDDEFYFRRNDIKSAVEGLIKYHEDKIEHMIKHLQEVEIKLHYPKNKMLETAASKALKNEYKSLNAIELWLEDAI